MQLSFEDGGRRLVIAGDITEESDFAPAVEQARGEVEVDLGGVRRINSSGVREWVGFVRAAGKSARLTLHRCPVSFVSQMNMISNFTGGARVHSVFVPRLCGGCGAIREDLAPVSELRAGKRDAPPCGKCQGAMELDADEEEYFAFLSKVE